jgi:hypothetical protein
MVEWRGAKVYGRSAICATVLIIEYYRLINLSIHDQESRYSRVLVPYDTICPRDPLRHTISKSPNEIHNKDNTLVPLLQTSLTFLSFQRKLSCHSLL